MGREGVALHVRHARRRQRTDANRNAHRSAAEARRTAGLRGHQPPAKPVGDGCRRCRIPGHLRRIGDPARRPSGGPGEAASLAAALRPRRPVPPPERGFRSCGTTGGLPVPGMRVLPFQPPTICSTRHGATAISLAMLNVLPSHRHVSDFAGRAAHVVLVYSPVNSSRRNLLPASHWLGRGAEIDFHRPHRPRRFHPHLCPSTFGFSGICALGPGGQRRFRLPARGDNPPAAEPLPDEASL